MILYQMCVIIPILSGIHVGLHAYPMISSPFLLNPGGQRYKKDSLNIEPNVDVLELEGLKQNNDEYNLNKSQKSLIFERHNSPNDRNIDSGTSESGHDTTTSLPVTLDSISSSMITPTNDESMPKKDTINIEQNIHHPPTLPHHDGTTNDERTPKKDTINIEQNIHHPPTLPHHDGAKANKDEISNHPSEQHINTDIGIASKSKPFHGAARLAFGQNPEILPTVTSTTFSSTTENTITKLNEDWVPRKERLVTDNPNIVPATTQIPASDEIMNNKEALGSMGMTEDLLTVLKPTERRSMTPILPKASNYLKQRRAGYSSFDLAQYIFWTGDEAGVTRAIDDLIQNGTLTREDALKFLKDVRLGIHYLQKSYNNRIVLQPHMHASSTEQSNAYFKQAVHHSEESNELDPDSAKVNTVENTILYKLAKIIFEESLARGADELQAELQKFTFFLKRKAQQGVIPLDLQKQILHILFRALSDTLNKHPELLSATDFRPTHKYSHLPFYSQDRLD